jgi:hypothetical protein
VLAWAEGLCIATFLRTIPTKNLVAATPVERFVAAIWTTVSVTKAASNLDEHSKQLNACHATTNQYEYLVLVIGIDEYVEQGPITANDGKFVLVNLVLAVQVEKSFHSDGARKEGRQEQRRARFFESPGFYRRVEANLLTFV